MKSLVTMELEENLAMLENWRVVFVSKLSYTLSHCYDTIEEFVIELVNYKEFVIEHFEQMLLNKTFLLLFPTLMETHRLP